MNVEFEGTTYEFPENTTEAEAIDFINVNVRSQSDVPFTPPLGTASVDQEQEVATEKDQIVSDEGSEDSSYMDSVDKLTGGIGHLMSAVEREDYPEGTDIPEDIRNSWFESDYSRAVNNAESFVPENNKDNVELHNILTNMSFNLGKTGLGKFKKMHKAIETEDWDTAADEMKDSKWYNQVGGRSKRLVERMRNLG